jgi:hypothetical protein
LGFHSEAIRFGHESNMGWWLIVFVESEGLQFCTNAMVCLRFGFRMTPLELYEMAAQYFK